MVKLYFVCMGNYYRSRLAEELALYYAAQQGIAVQVDSGGLSKIPNLANVGPIAHETLLYLQQKNIQPQGATRMPKKCDWLAIQNTDIVVLTDADEQLERFKQAFPEYTGQLIGWQARDKQYDPWLNTLELIDLKSQELIKQLADTL